MAVGKTSLCFFAMGLLSRSQCFCANSLLSLYPKQQSSSLGVGPTGSSKTKTSEK